MAATTPSAGHCRQPPTPADARVPAAADSSTLPKSQSEPTSRIEPWWTPAVSEEEREELFYGKLTVWSKHDPDDKIETNPWGTATDVATAVLEAIDNEDVGGFVIAMARGVPDDVAINPRESDPR